MILKMISKAFEELDIFHPHLIGFRPNMRTSTNILILKTLMDINNSVITKSCIAVLFTFQKHLTQFGLKDCSQNSDPMEMKVKC